MTETRGYCLWWICEQFLAKVENKLWTQHLNHSSSNSTCRFQSMQLGDVGKCVHRVPSSMQHVRRQ